MALGLQQYYIIEYSMYGNEDPKSKWIQYGGLAFDDLQDARSYRRAIIAAKEAPPWNDRHTEWHLRVVRVTKVVVGEGE